MSSANSILAAFGLAAGIAAAEPPAEILRFKRAGAPAELPMYGSGGHGFGLRAANTRPVGTWIVRFEEWLIESGVLTRK